MSSARVQHSLLCLNTALAVEDATHGLARSGLDTCYPAVGLRMAVGCANLEGALISLSRLYGRASRAVGIQLTTDHEEAILSVHMDAADEADVAFLEENYLGWAFMQVLYFLGRTPPISEVTLRDPHHFCLGMPHWGIPGTVRYGEVTAIRFPRWLLGQPPAARAGVNVMWECHQPWMALFNRGASTSLASYVSGEGFVRFSDVVRESGKSTSTLRRRLQASGGGFRAARRRALTGVAIERLCQSDQNIEALSSELGYADVRSFRRFIKAATGLTPQQIRARRGIKTTDDDDHVLSELNAICARMNI
jgi:AraC-like DNA-binding protein